MKKDEVKVDGTYLAKVNGGVVPVRITAEKWQGDKHVGWVGVNTLTNRSVRIKSAQRLRAEVKHEGGGRDGGGQDATGGTTAAPPVKPPNYMSSCCSLDRAVKAAVKAGDPLVQERVQDLRIRATAAYKAKDYAEAVRLHNHAHAALAGGNGATAAHAGEEPKSPGADAPADAPAEGGAKGGKGGAKGAAHLRAQAKADQENARMRDEREASPDGMTASERAMAQTAAAKPAPTTTKTGKPAKA